MRLGGPILVQESRKEDCPETSKMDYPNHKNCHFLSHIFMTILRDTSHELKWRWTLNLLSLDVMVRP